MTRAERIYRMVQDAPDGLPTGAIAAAFGTSGRRASASLNSLRPRVARDPVSGLWRAGIGDDRADGRAVLKVVGITAEDLAWMQAQRDRAAAKAQRLAERQSGGGGGE